MLKSITPKKIKLTYNSSELFYKKIVLFLTGIDY